MKHPFLIGETFYLRAIEATDVNESYQQWFNDEEICRFNGHHRFPMYMQDMEAYFRDVIQTKQNLILAICDKETDAHVGNISLQSIDPINRSAEFAIIIGNKDFWGKGIAKEAGRLVIGHGFKSLNLHRIYCGTSKENMPMQKLAAKLGFVQEGIARESLFKNGAYQDAIEYGILANEYDG